MNTINDRYSLPAKLIHMGLAVFGILAYLTAETAEHSDGGIGYLLHTYLGLTLMAFILLRIVGGYTGLTKMRFSSWSPFSRSQWSESIDDIKSLIKFTMPERGMHEGLAGLVQAFGLIIFAWMGATGTALYFINESTNGTLYEIFEEAHEIGESLIPMFLVLHVGAVITHSLTGKPNWKRIWHFKN